MRAFIHSFDGQLTAWIQSWPAWLYQPMLAITNVGQPLTIILFACGLLVWALWHGQTHLAAASIVVLTTVIVSSGLKLVLRRSRPETEYVANMIYQSFSFPSGHSAAATVGFGFIAYLAFAGLSLPWSAVIGGVAIAFGLLVGLSRVYLGAHYPSDVAGGMALGLAGLGVLIFVASPLS